ncbi:glycosyltransferase family 9 protein [Kiritimatiellota bacterium B12222]|nr:glycosyltransferase family 9 protein [Kiritimatiellota bacterium B12222]
MGEVERILVIKLSALGDLFHAVPVAHLLAEHYHCKIDWVTQPEYVGLVSCHDDVDRVIAFPRRGGWQDRKVFISKLRERKYDIAIDLQGLTKSGVVLGLCRAHRKIGSSSPRELSGWFAKERPQALAKSPHALDQLLDVLRHLGQNTTPIEYPLHFPEAEQLPLLPAPRIALAPRSRWPAKDWPEASFIALGRRLIAEQQAKIYIIGGPEDQDLGARIQSALGESAVNTCGQFPILALGPQLKQMDVLVCNDSGPMHFASAVGTPLVALFGPTDPAKTGPWGEGAIVLRPPADSEGYPDHRSYKHGNNQFISKISIEEVYTATCKQLNKSSI